MLLSILTNTTFLISLISIIPILLLILYLTIQSKWSHWKKKGVYYIKPSFPFGNMKEAILAKKRPFFEVQDEFYKEIKNEAKQPFGGIYTMTLPMLLVHDPDMLRYIMVKDFDVFMNRGVSGIDYKKEPLFKHLFTIEGHDWKLLRNKLSPTFTSGKIKSMFPIIEQCSETFVTNIKSNIKEDTSNEIEIEVKEYCSRYTTDVIGTTVFGLEINSIKNPNSEFRDFGKAVTETFRTFLLKQTIFTILPFIRDWFNLTFLPKNVANFFQQLMDTNIDYRIKNNIHRDDFLNILIELQKAQIGKEIASDDIEFTNEVIAAQGFVFFVAGYDTSSSTMTFSLYELAMNKDIQSKLRQEIRNTIKEHGGKLTYDAIQSMTYLDKVIKETLRKYPLVIQLLRISNRPYEIPNTNVTLDAGTRIGIPVWSIHHDPEYYPDPDNFDPERFTQENIDSRPHYTYLPFGEGPRNCIGLRFGLTQVKTGLAQLLSQLEFNIDPEYEVLEHSPGFSIASFKKPLKLKVSPI